MTKDITRVLEALFFAHESRQALGGVDIAGLPQSNGRDAIETFLHRLTSAETEWASNAVFNPNIDEFLTWGAKRMRAELAGLSGSDGVWGAAVREAADAVRSGELNAWGTDAARLLWPVFFPEGAELLGKTEAAVEKLRNRRAVELTELNRRPLTDPASELLFTSNVLLTIPHTREEIAALPVSSELKERIEAAYEEEQRYYYDHPIHIGTPIEKNEVIYGLRGLDDAVAYEKLHGRARPEARVSVVLSLSVTHDGLHAVGRDYLEGEIARSGGLEHLRVYLFTELDCRAVVQHVFGPLLQDAPHESADEELHGVFGVDGEYGRHYSFLKAIAAFWQVFVDSRVKATFKIDLDQVFPQRELEEQTGLSAFGHFMTPLWGARGIDSTGIEVDFGMIAGALVNEKDIPRGVFTPDVPHPRDIPPGEAAVFFNKLPMAVSTRAEMGARYHQKSQCIERFHVTGGTNGVLVDHLMRYRPFTPTFIGRAEDQAYLLSVLYAADNELAAGWSTAGDGEAACDPDGSDMAVLRYVHEPGLIMRHDKEAFAGESIAAAENGRFVGDLVRTFYFTRYAESLSWGRVKIKECLDPFTGCFITTRMYTVIMLRLMLRVAHLLSAAAEDDAISVLELASAKLTPLFKADDGTDFVGAQYRRERGAWQAYYEVLSEVQEETPPDEVLKRARTEATRIVSAARLV